MKKIAGILSWYSSKLVEIDPLVACWEADGYGDTIGWVAIYF